MRKVRKAANHHCASPNRSSSDRKGHACRQMVSTVKADYAEKYAKAHEGMMAVQKSMMAGEKAQLCNFCTSMGGLMMGGAKMEKFTTSAGDVALISATSEEMISKIHAHGQKSIDFMAAMKKDMSKTADPHAGHSH